MDPVDISLTDAEPIDEARPSSTFKKNGAARKPKPRVGFTTTDLAIMKSSYNKHFGLYGKNKVNLVQKLLAKVWQSVYAEYLKAKQDECIVDGVAFDLQKLPTKRALQDGLRGSMSKEETGNADLKGAEKVTLQNDEVLADLKKTDGHARRNMIQFREDLIAGRGGEDTAKGKSVADGGDSGGIGESKLKDADPQLARDKTEKKAQHETRSQVQVRAANSLEKMTRIMSSNGKRTLNVLEEQKQISKKKLEVYEKKSERDVISMDLKNLAFLRDNGVITNDEFFRRASILF